MKVKIYVEGGGQSGDLNTACREGFRKFLNKLGLGKNPSITASGGRNDAIDAILTALRTMDQDETILLWIDSESPLENSTSLSEQIDKSLSPFVSDDQILLMVTCSETWIAADRNALQVFFGNRINLNALPALHDIEHKLPKDVLTCLKNATRGCTKVYSKGRVAYELFARIDPNVVSENCESARRCVRLLQEHCR